MAGLSTRFPGERPKWSLTAPNGNMMAAEALKGLTGWDRLVVGMNAADVDRFTTEAVEEEFAMAGFSAQVFDLGSPPSQADSASRLLALAGVVDGAITIKDCDNQFRLQLRQDTSVAYVDLHDCGPIVPGNKSYIRLRGGSQDLVEDIAEKSIISPRFCCGAYTFASPALFLRHASDVEHVSHVLSRLLRHGEIVRANQAAEYLDWGTGADWKAYRSQFKTLFVDVDGVLVEASHRSFAPRWGESKVIQANVDYLNGLHATGKVELVLTTSRDEEFRAETEKQLAGLHYDHLLMGLQGGARYLINDVVSARGEQTCYAVSVERNAPTLEQAMKVQDGSSR